jgi:pyruvate/2-oxoglutarate dehydrogenase complex dihydrolipoamide acyltransferase (E2) component
MTAPPAGPRELDQVRLGPVRRITIERLEKSREMVPVSLFVDVDAERVLELSERRDVTVTTVLAKLLAATLRDHPNLNARLTPDAIVRYAEVFLGVAVALPDGNLTVAVVRRADELPLERLGQVIADLAARARAGKLGLEDVRGARFTISSVGTLMPGVFGTPVIPPDQSGILLVSGAHERCVWREGRAASRRCFPLSLTVDHRIVNGMGALGFLKELVARIEGPESWLEGSPDER